MLDRRRVPHGALVLASHTAFDEVLTTGYNVPLAARLGMEVEDAVTMQGYKGDPNRRIGIVGRLLHDFDGGALLAKSPRDNSSTPKQHDPHEAFYNDLRAKVQREFKTPMEWFPGTDGGSELGPGGNGIQQWSKIGVLAIMNAFDQEVVGRVDEARRRMGWTSSADSGTTLYLTGQPRKAGVEAAMKHEMHVGCVGHRSAEEWGIRYIALCLTHEFPDIGINVVLEEEEVVRRERFPNQAATIRLEAKDHASTIITPEV